MRSKLRFVRLTSELVILLFYFGGFFLGSFSVFNVVVKVTLIGCHGASSEPLKIYTQLFIPSHLLTTTL